MLVLAALLGGCHFAPFSPEATEDRGGDSIETLVAKLVNDHREAIGCPRLAWDEKVAQVALEHSTDMAERAYFAHEDPEGRGLKDRLRRARIDFAFAAENIAAGFRYENPAEAVVEGWKNSPDHRAVIENCSFLAHGVGFAEFRWTHIFVR